MISDAESYAYGTLVTHICGSATSPLCLHVAYTAGDWVVFGIHEECDTDVDDFGDKGIGFLVVGMGFYLSAYMHIPLIYN